MSGLITLLIRRYQQEVTHNPNPIYTYMILLEINQNKDFLSDLSDGILINISLTFFQRNQLNLEK